MSGFVYRPDVDGLRAVAVVLVMLFHADLGCSGGYIGVDVFFVISGFLITGLILKETEAGTFTLRRFWVRRIRRILPAAAVMVLGTLCLGAAVLAPGDFDELGRSAIANQLMVSNVWFWQNAGYFAGASELKPLLHTWSLAVEEQFYLGYPLLLMLLLSRAAVKRRRCGRVLAVIAVMSFLLSVWGSYRYSTATFFLLPTRAWELLMGGLIWFAPSPERVSTRWSSTISTIALAGIVVAAFTYDSSTRFPGIAALVPCVATAALIWANTAQTTWVTACLSLRLPVFIGLLSYSLYLWHWPLLVLARYAGAEPLDAIHRAMILATSVPLAFLSWRFVETPLRRPETFAGRRPFIAAFGGAAAMVLLVSMVVVGADGVPDRFDRRTRRLLASMENSWFRRNVPLAAIRSGELPQFGQPGRSPQVLVWGDSHAMTMIPAIDRACRARGICGVQATFSSTLPLTGFSSGRKWEAPAGYGQAVVDYASDIGIDVVICTGYWSRDAEDPRFSEALRGTVEKLLQADIRVILVRDIPEQDGDPRRTLLSLSDPQELSRLGVTLDEHRDRQRHADRALLGTRAAGVRVLDPTPFLVDAANRCRLFAEDACLYQNEDHLSTAGATRLTPMFHSLFEDLAMGAGPGTGALSN